MAVSLEQLRADFKRDGVVIVRNVIPPEQVRRLREVLEEIFARSNYGKVGVRTDFSSAAEQQKREGKPVLEEPEPQIPLQHDKLLEVNADIRPGKYLTEIEAGRWHKGLRDWEHNSALPGVVGELVETKELRFFGDHIFLKEQGSRIKTAFHQDTPYFAWDGDQAGVCWVPVDRVTKESGVMKYVKGSHKWPSHAPRLLISNEKTHEAMGPNVPELPEDLEATNVEILSWDCEPGDVIIHHPNTVHGSAGNTTLDKRRLAASIRYIGDDVRWRNKQTNPPPEVTWVKWHAQRSGDTFKAGNFRQTEISKSRSTEIESRKAKPVDPDRIYSLASVQCYAEMQDGETMDARECARLAFPVVWRSSSSSLLASSNDAPTSRL